MVTEFGTNQTSSSRVFVDPQTLFSLRVPENWLIDTSGQQGTKVILLHPSTDTPFRTNVNVTVPALHNLTAEEFLTLARLQLKQLTGLPRPERDEPACRPAGGHELEWSMALGPIMIRTRQLIIVDNANAYVVTATAPAESLVLYQRDFDIVFDSFHLQSSLRT